MSRDQKKVQGIYKVIEEEAASCLKEVKSFLQSSQGAKTGQADFDASLIDQKHFLGREEQINQ